MAHSVFTWDRTRIEESARLNPQWMSNQLCAFHRRPLTDHVELRIVAVVDGDGNYKTFDILNCEMETA